MNEDLNTKFNQMKRYFFDFSTVQKFIEYLTTKAKVIAPHKKGENSYSYEVVDSSATVIMDYPRTIQPLKKYFLPPSETLLRFNLEKNEFTGEEIPEEQKIFFAIHAYELEAIQRLDFSFKRGDPESNYFNRRKNSIFIGVSYSPDKWHFSKSVGIEIEKYEGFCLYFEHVENGYLVFILDADGEKLISEFGEGIVIDTPMNFAITEKEFKSKIKYHYNRLPQVFDHIYRSKVWDAVAKECLGCGTCNLLCPTCYCFDVRDEVEINMREGKRERYWDSCMLNTFAEVAGGENFRDKLNNRTRHRLYRKFKYITEHSGDLHCVGCGRCSRYCPAGIDIIEIINNLILDYEDQNQKQLV